MPEVIIHHSYSSESPKPTKRGRFFSEITFKLAKVLGVLGLLFIAYSFLPSVWFYIVSGGPEKISQILARPVVESDEEAVFVPLPKSDYQPRLDPSLPLQNQVRIISIGVDSSIHEATPENYEEALKQGIWRVPDFGTPANRERPVILVAHRFGYLAWSNSFRRTNSFYNLSKVEKGDVVEIVWRQRKYVYEVYGESRGEEITDYTADLILYTCETLNSPVRIFRYARLLEI